MFKVKRGDVFLANLSDATGSEQAFVRPVVIIQNNCGNKHSPTTIVACLSSKIESKSHLPTHYILPEGIGLKHRSMVLCEQIKVIDKSRLLKNNYQKTKGHKHRINHKKKISHDLKKKKKKKS